MTMMTWKRSTCSPQKLHSSPAKSQGASGPKNRRTFSAKRDGAERRSGGILPCSVLHGFLSHKMRINPGSTRPLIKDHLPQHAQDIFRKGIQ